MDFTTLRVDDVQLIVDDMDDKTKNSSSPILRIAVLGVGGIGSSIAFQMANTGKHEVTAIARPGSSRLRQLRTDNGIIAINGEHADVQVMDALDEQVSYDLIVVTVLAHRVDAVLPALKRSTANCILFMFQTFNPERLQNEIGSERCAFGMPFIQAFLAQDGKLNATVGGQKTRLSDQKWVDAFVGAGLPSAFEPDMLLWLRCHVPLCIAFESVSIAAVQSGNGASWAESLVLARGVKAGFALIEALGYKIYPSEKILMKSSPAGVLAAMLWSMSRNRGFRELLATGAGECSALVDELVAVASQANPKISTTSIEAMRPTK